MQRVGMAVERNQDCGSRVGDGEALYTFTHAFLIIVSMNYELAGKIITSGQPCQVQAFFS
ncbi:MAG: hypothetical protein JRD68_15490 [Deltaproteobacteria bacterium]|nr:hypothetical protein [Deltaproteobacteria bacterium]